MPYSWLSVHLCILAWSHREITRNIMWKLWRRVMFRFRNTEIACNNCL
jgi:hypothetical protein